nr:interleukin-19 isoform X1 [Kogia breviceps]
MQAQCVSLCLLGVIFFLCSAHVGGLRRCLISMDMRRMEESFRGIKNAIQAKDTFQNVTILSTSETLHSIKPLDVCCVTKNLLAFYVDRVFKDHQELSPQILRKISSIANSFLYMQKTLQRCVSHQQHLLSICPRESPGHASPSQCSEMDPGLSGNSLPCRPWGELLGASSSGPSLSRASSSSDPVSSWIIFLW